MRTLFDAYQRDYGAAVQSSIDFSGLKHDFFLAAKARLLERKMRAYFGRSDVSLLDVGCGVGALHPYLSATFAKICGVDVSAPCIGTAHLNNAGVDYLAFDGEKLPFADGAFDVTLTVCVMHHVPPAQWPGFMAEMARVTRKGGLVCVIEHNPLNPLTRLAVARCRFDADAVLLTSWRTQRLMRKAGIVHIASDYFLLLPSAAPIVGAIERATARLPLGAQYLTLGER